MLSLDLFGDLEVVRFMAFKHTFGLSGTDSGIRKLLLMVKK